MKLRLLFVIVIIILNSCWMHFNNPFLPSNINVLSINKDILPVFTQNANIGNIAFSSFNIKTSINVNGTVYYLVLDDGSTAPTPSQIINPGTYGIGLAASGNKLTTADTTADLFVSELCLSTSYDVYLVAENQSHNLSAVQPKIDVTTLSTSQLGKFVSSDGAANDAFGLWVSTSSDGKTIAVSTAGNSSGQGACYVFEWNGSTYTQSAKLTASDGLANDQLGRSVSISADGAIIVAGAVYDDIGANSDQGSAYVFVKSGTWSDATETAKLTASDGGANDQLGTSVGISADGSTIVLGSYCANIGANIRQGCAYVYVKSGNWVSTTQSAKLIASDGAFDDRMGYAGLISGDGSTIVVGAMLCDIAANSDQGATYVFEKGPGWSGAITQAAKLISSDGAAGDYFGGSVSISYDGSTIVSGGRNNSGNKGAVYVYEKGAGWSGTISQTAKLTVSTGINGDHFGWSCSISSNGKIIVAGAQDYNGSQGAAYIFSRSGANWVDVSEKIRLTASDGVGGDYFASYGCCISADGTTIAAGAFRDDCPNFDQGSFYVFK